MSDSNSLHLEIIYDKPPPVLPRLNEEHRTLVAFNPYANDLVVEVGSCRIDLGFGLKIPEEYEVMISTIPVLRERGIVLENKSWDCTQGDSRLKLFLKNTGAYSFTIPKNASIATIVFVKKASISGVCFKDTCGNHHPEGSWKTIDKCW